MNKSKRDQPPGIFQKEQHFEKYLYIFLYGSLLWGCLAAFLSSFLIELVHASFQINEFFLQNLRIRFLISAGILMVAGSGFGHWRWTYRNHKLQTQKYCLKNQSFHFLLTSISGSTTHSG